MQLVVVINNLFTMSDNIFIIDNEILFYTQYIIAPIVSVLVLLLILQIKKNGVSYWKAMDSDAPLLTFNAPQGGPYCPKCGSKNLETSNFCTSCGAALKYSALSAGTSLMLISSHAAISASVPLRSDSLSI